MKQQVMFFLCVFYIGAFSNQNPTEEKQKARYLNHFYPWDTCFLVWGLS